MSKLFIDDQYVGEVKIDDPFLVYFLADPVKLTSSIFAEYMSFAGTITINNVERVIYLSYRQLYIKIVPEGFEKVAGILKNVLWIDNLAVVWPERCEYFQREWNRYKIEFKDNLVRAGSYRETFIVSYSDFLKVIGYEYSRIGESILIEYDDLLTNKTRLYRKLAKLYNDSKGRVVLQGYLYLAKNLREEVHYKTNRDPDSWYRNLANIPIDIVDGEFLRTHHFTLDLLNLVSEQPETKLHPELQELLTILMVKVVK